MKMCLRWFGNGHDSVKLEEIRQIPSVNGVVTTLYDEMAGSKWNIDKIKKIKKDVEDAGLKIYGIESVNISDDIKAGTDKRDEHIENYIETIKALASLDIKLICYNFMPVFDWTRSSLAMPREDGSTVLAYNQKDIDKIDPERIFTQMDKDSNGFVLPGWEPERMNQVKYLFELYKDIENNKLRENLIYFLKKIMPTCEDVGVYMAIHIDDPAWEVFGLPRIVKNKEDLYSIFEAVPSKYNGVTLCTGSLSSVKENNIPDIIRSLEGRIHFAHVRNTLHIEEGVFQEAAHISKDGSLDMYEIMKALYDIGFDGPVRPDHGRAIWGEISIPGYGLYDRALGSQYLLGLLEAIEKSEGQKQT